MHQLLSATSADTYADAMHQTVDRLAGRLRDTAQPFSGASRTQLQELVDAVDLDGPGLGTATALREADDAGRRARRLVPPPRLRGPPQLPGRRPGGGRRGDHRGGQPVAGHLRPVDRSARSWSAGWSTGPADGSGSPAGDGVFTSGGTQSNLQALLLAREAALAGGRPRADRLRDRRDRVQPLQRAEVRAPARPRRRRGAAGARPTPTAGWTPRRSRVRWTRCAAIDHVADVRRRDRRHHRPRLPSTRWRRSPTSASAPGCGCTSTPPTAAGCWSRRRRRHLLDGIERARSVTVDFHKSFFQPVSSSALLVRGPARPAARHLARRLPQPRGRRRAQPGGQVAADDPPVRRAQALDDAARARRRRRSGRCSTRCSTWPRACTTRWTATRTSSWSAAPQLSTVAVPVPAASTCPTTQADRLVPLVRRVLFESGRAVVAKTVVDGRPCLKLTLLNPETTLERRARGARPGPRRGRGAGRGRRPGRVQREAVRR